LRNICLCWTIPRPVRCIFGVDGTTAAEENHTEQAGPVGSLRMGRLSVGRCRWQPVRRLGFETLHRFQSLCFFSVMLLRFSALSRPVSNRLKPGLNSISAASAPSSPARACPPWLKPLVSHLWLYSRFSQIKQKPLDGTCNRSQLPAGSSAASVDGSRFRFSSGASNSAPLSVSVWL
jgi:hypothetical protein